MQTVLITGCSSGYGLETARHFHSQGWHVIASMRTPAPECLPQTERMQVVPLDVTRPASIAQAIEAAGPIDVLVNNAGLGLFGAFEATPLETIDELFATNTRGVMALTQAVLPQMRKRRSGTIVNVTSSVTLAAKPLVAVYTATKMAIEGFSASLALELATFGIRTKLVEPGYCPNTNFATNGQHRMAGLITEPYASFAAAVFATLTQPRTHTHPTDVAEAVFRAANDESEQLRFPAGADALALAAAPPGGSLIR